MGRLYVDSEGPDRFVGGGIPKITKITVLQEDHGPVSESSFAIRDQDGAHLGDAADLAGATQIAVELCEHHGIDEFTVQLAQG